MARGAGQDTCGLANQGGGALETLADATKTKFANIDRSPRLTEDTSIETLMSSGALWLDSAPPGAVETFAGEVTIADVGWSGLLRV